MANNIGREWENEIITNRVTVSKNLNSVRVSIKAPVFSLGNNVLTLCITMGIVAEAALAYLMIKSSINLALLVPGFIVLGAGLSLAFVKFWLWHNFGEELININGNSFEMNRHYGLFKSDVSQLILNRDSELLTNRTDKWSWVEFRSKGIFRLATTDAKLADFGLNLSDQEFEMIIRPIADQLDHVKKQAEGIQFSHSTPQAEAVTAVAVEELQPPSLEQQTEGQHLTALSDYLEKTTNGNSVRKYDKSESEHKEKA